MNPSSWTSAVADAGGNIAPLSDHLINPGANNNHLHTSVSPVHTATSQVAHMSLPDNLQENVSGSGGQLPLHTNPIAPSTLDLMPSHVQEPQTSVGGHNPSFIQSPVSPLVSPILYSPSLAPSPVGQPLLQQSLSALSLNPMESNTIPPHLIHNYGTLNPTMFPNTLSQTSAFVPNTGIFTFAAQPHLSQQQLQLLQQQHQHQLRQQQLQLLQSQQQQQQQLYQQSNANIQQHNLAQPIFGEASTQAQTLNKMFAEMNVSSPSVSTDFNHNVNTLPQTLPTTLNRSLQKKTFRNSTNLSIGSSSPTSPKNGPFQGSWEGFEDANTSGIGSSVCSPASPGDVWMDYMTPQYDRPTDKDQCLRCGQKVYAMEKVGPIKEILYHKNCFTCVACGTKLTLKTFHHNPNDMDDYNIFCASHKPRIFNLASEGNAVYLAKSVPVVTPRAAKVSAQDHQNEIVGTPIGPYTTSIKMEKGEKSPNILSREQIEVHSYDEKTSNKSEGSENMSQVKHASNSTGIRNNPSNGGSSPFSSMSSSSSLATRLEADLIEDSECTERDNESRSDRPSRVSCSNTSSSDDIMKTKEGNIDQNSVCERTSSSELTRRDRPSSFHRSISSNVPVSKTVSDIRQSSKVLVKSRSSHEFSTLNDLRKGIHPSRLLTRNESMRLDRPSQFH